MNTVPSAPVKIILPPFTEITPLIVYLLMATATLQGLYGTPAAAGTYANDAATYYKPITGWMGALTIGGSPWAEVAAANITIQPNTQIFATSSGTQNPTGKIEGEFEIFGTMTILPTDDTQWDVYRAMTVQDVELTFLTSHYIADTTPYQIKLELTQFTLEDYTRNRQGIAQGAEIAFRTVYHATDGPGKLTTVCRMPV